MISHENSPAGFTCPMVSQVSPMVFYPNRSPTIARHWGPCRPHKERKDAGEDVYL